MFSARSEKDFSFDLNFRSDYTQMIHWLLNNEKESVLKPDRSFFSDIKWAIETRLKILAVLPKKFSEKDVDEVDEDDTELIESEVVLEPNGR